MGSRILQVIGAPQDLLPLASVPPPSSGGRRTPLREPDFAGLESGAYLPDAGDPRWENWTRPLQAFLVVSRTWSELHTWAVERRIAKSTLGQLLAWLSCHDKISSLGDRKKPSLGWGPFTTPSNTQPVRTAPDDDVTTR